MRLQLPLVPSEDMQYALFFGLNPHKTVFLPLPWPHLHYDKSLVIHSKVHGQLLVS